MSRFVRLSAAGVLSLAITSVGLAQGDDLTGAWYGADGITLSVRQVGKDVWWVARSGDGGKTFTAVFRGKLDGDKLTGDFADVPEGKNQLHGTLKARLVSRDGKVVSIEGELLFPGNDTPVAWAISRARPEK